MPDRGDDGSATAPAGAREAFSLLAHDIRLDIVLALLDNWAAVYTEPQSYSELMAAVGMEDSGKFNYHLDKLRGVYVAETDDGYVPTASATALYRAVLAHRPTDAQSVTRSLDDACPHCGGQLVEEYDRAFYTIGCTDCDNWEGLTYSFPQNGLQDRTGSDRYQAVVRRASHHIGLARSGQCPYCAGPIAFDLAVDLPTGGEPGIEMACETCSWAVGVNLLTAVQFVPEVAGALHDIGVERPLLERSMVDRLRGGVRSENPLELAVTATTDQGTLTVVADDELSVLSVERGDEHTV